MELSEDFGNLYKFEEFKFILTLTEQQLLFNLIHVCVYVCVYVQKERGTGREREIDRREGDWLVEFCGISTIVGYLMPNPLYTYILNI